MLSITYLDNNHNDDYDHVTMVDYDDSDLSNGEWSFYLQQLTRMQAK